MTFFHKAAGFINKETHQNNESRKMAVLLRILIIWFNFVLLFSIAFCAYNGIRYGVESSIIMMAIYGIVFYLSYKVEKKISVWLFIVASILWSNIALWLFGWFCGMQTLVLQLIMIYYFSEYGKLFKKALFSLFIFGVYMGMYFQYAHRSMSVELSFTQYNILRIANVLLIIVSISSLAYIFSNDSQEMENKLIEYNKKLEKKSSTDPLTGLYNRGKAMEILGELEKAAKDEIFCLCICDIDFFKRVNDNYGHDVGDKVLIEVSNILSRIVKGFGYVARWGGEEFMIIFPKTNGDDACTVIYTIQSEIKKMSVMCGDEEIKVTLTYGLCEYYSEMSLTENIKDADNKLYTGKEEGRNRLIY